MAGEQKFRLVDNPHVLENYVSRFVSGAFDGGAIVITLGATRFVPERMDEMPRPGKEPTVHITARLAMSPACAAELVSNLSGILNTLARKGVGGASAGVAPTAEDREN